MSRKTKRKSIQRATRRGAVSLPSSPWDHGATGPANRIGLVVEQRGEIDPATGKRINPNGVTGVRRVDMLEVYHARGVISARGHAAGGILRDAWEATGKGTCAPFMRERVDSSPKPDEAVTVQIDHMAALLRVSKMVAPEDERILHCVCALGVGIGNLLEYRGLKHDAGKVHLRDALERLADRMERRRGP